MTLTVIQLCELNVNATWDGMKTVNSLSSFNGRTVA